MEGKVKKRCAGGKRPTSFGMQDHNLVFKELDLKEGESFLDLGCGIGDYSMEALNYIGERGTVHAMDVNSESLAYLEKRAGEQQAGNIRTAVVDAADRLPLTDNSINSCLIATALHAMDLAVMGDSLFAELSRVVKRDGRLSIIECKKDRLEFGPPQSCRLSAEDLEVMLAPYGFRRHNYVDLGFNYLVQFSREEQAQK